MVTTRSAKLSLTDYLTSNTEYDSLQEFEDGETIVMPPESPQNLLITMFLISQFLQVVPFNWVRHNTEIVVSNRVRIPDLIILGSELAETLHQSHRSTITEAMPTPLLVIEVVSPGKVNRDRDYRYKRSEYGTRGIPEYWIVDPEQQQILILTLIDGWYEIETFTDDSPIQSPQFPTLTLTTTQILNPTP
ncbi:MAG: Uma2 family endonuclease [Leptolyngbyaceae bacterium]|nr:Uma2 family endonuclease [Leptolyngbyaceae bacterium]